MIPAFNSTEEIKNGKVCDLNKFTIKSLRGMTCLKKHLKLKAVRVNNCTFLLYNEFREISIRFCRFYRFEKFIELNICCNLPLGI